MQAGSNDTMRVGFLHNFRRSRKMQTLPSDVVVDDDRMCNVVSMGAYGLVGMVMKSNGSVDGR